LLAQSVFDPFLLLIQALMTFASNPGFLAVAFMEGSAAFILWVLYWLLVPGFSARFFRYWLAGWTVYVAMEGLRIYSLWQGGPNEPRFDAVLSLMAAALFLAAVLDCLGRGKTLKYLWPLGGIVASIFLALGSVQNLPNLQRNAESLFECLLYLGAGWLLWRSQDRHSGVGWKLLAGAFFLRGLHGLDRSDWAAHSLGLFRVSFEGLFGIMMGIAMAVLVLEAGRVRNEELNEKLRRLALITAEATQSLKVDDALQGVLRHLVESLAASHGAVFLRDDSGIAATLSVRASVGFSDRFRKQSAHTPVSESHVQAVLNRDTPFASYRDTPDLTVRRWMETEKLESIVLVRIRGKEGPLGLLAIGSANPRTFGVEEEHYLVNVANLLGLTVQNVALFESAAASRRQWLDTFDSIDDLILVHALDGRVIRANRPLAELLNSEPESLVGRFVRDVLRQGSVHPWSRCPYCEGAAGKSDTIDPSFSRYYLATDSALHDSDGSRLGTIHVLKDFTTSRQAENKFRTLFEKVQEGVFISTPEGHFVDFNDAFMRILGFESHDDLLRADLPAQLYVDPADRERRQRLLEEYGEVVDFEFEFRRSDGEIRTAHESSFATRDDTGGVVAYQGFLLDITDQKQAEIDVRRRNRALVALNAISELLGQAVALEDGLTAALLKITELFAVSAAAVYFLEQPSCVLKRAVAVGYESESARRNAPMQMSPTLLEQIRQTHATLLSGSLPALPEEIRELHRKEGIQVSQVVVLWAKDRVMGILIVGNRDARALLTAELNLLSAVGNQIATTIDKSLLLEKTREAYDTLRRTQEQLLQSEKMAAVGQLISGVAHELNNPLTAILGYSQLLKSEEFVHARGADYLEKLYKQAQRTHHIVQNLLSFARQQKPYRAPVQLNQILEDTLVLREFDMKLHNIVIHREFDARLPMTDGDFHQLEQVFLNLLNNAVDAIQETGASGEIWIHTQAEGDRLRVEITDSGPGVTNPHKIFDPFYTTKPVGKGTGLGLSICYGIVKEHGGEIQVRNAPPRGACFCITLPLSRDSSTAATEPMSRRDRSMPGTILLVDHEEALLLLEQEVLVSSGATVKIARTAEEAIEILTRDMVDAVVSDINLPGKTSTAGLYCWIKEHRADLTMRVVFTASNAGDSAAHILRSSGCHVLAKPFPVEELCRSVQSVLAVPVPSMSRR
jgi:two-component system NtrC family sensor kinase